MRTTTTSHCEKPAPVDDDGSSDDEDIESERRQFLALQEPARRYAAHQVYDSGSEIMPRGFLNHFCCGRTLGNGSIIGQYPEQFCKRRREKVWGFVEDIQVGEIIGRFEKKGFTLKGLKFLNVDQTFAEKHYADLSSKPLFNGLVEYIVSGPVVAMVWEGKNVVLTGRKIIGATNPADSALGTIRGDFAVDIGRNVIHGSDTVESAKKEIALWFPEGTTNWSSSIFPWVYES